MKNLLKSAIVIGSLMSFACQPKDDKLQRQTTTNGGTGTQDATAGSDMTGQELNQLLALTFDRMSEAVHVLKATLNPEYAVKYNIIVSDQKDQKSVINKDLNNRVDLSDLKIVSVKNETNTKDKGPTTKNTNFNLNVRRLLTDENGTVLQFLAVKEVADEIRNTGYIYDAKKAPVDFSSVTQTESLSIQQIEPGRYAVKVSRGDDVSSKKDSNSLMITRLAFEFLWSGKIVDLDGDLKLKLGSIDLARKGNKRGFLNLTADTTSNGLILKLGDCASLDGLVKISIKQAKNTPDLVRNVQVNDSTIKFEEEKSFESKAISCAGRPVVDLTRML